ncbi:MAG: hypothetical protein LBT01_09000 [Spirochaetaceae bacterium]|jgi:hypothetical protein|nr:hypothetical protein [Spirochaetaceae bacterium]
MNFFVNPPSAIPAIPNSKINHERHEPHEQIAYNSHDFCLVSHQYSYSLRLPFVLFVRFVVEFGTAAATRVHFQILGKSGGIEERAADIGVPEPALAFGAECQHGGKAFSGTRVTRLRANAAAMLLVFSQQ